MVKPRIALLLLTISIIFAACSSSKDDIILVEHKNGKISLLDFEKAYLKNSGGVENAKKDSIEKLRNFLDLFAAYKLKLEDAKKRDFENNEELINELNAYKMQVGETFVLEKKLVQPFLENLYEGRKVTRKVSHIMIVPVDQTEEEARAFALELIDSLNNKGADFNEFVQKYSVDEPTKHVGGWVGYIAKGEVYPSFEKAIYNTEIGKVADEPVKSAYGFHIIKVEKETPRTLSVRAAHILIKTADNLGVDISEEALDKANEILARIKSGEDFSEFAKQYSEDEGSAPKGGDLGFFERRMMVPEFEEAAFGLGIGEVSGLVKSPFGYHIIKVLDKKGLPSFEEERENLRQIYNRIYAKDAKAKFINDLKNKFNYVQSKDIIEKITKYSDSSKIGPDYWEAEWRDKIKDETVYTIDGVGLTVDQFIERMENEPQYTGKKMLSAILYNAMVSYADRDILFKEALELEKSDEEFGTLMNDYKNGIFIFKLQELEVWNKINVDSAKIAGYYDKTKENYNWPDRVDFSEIFLKNDSIAKSWRELISKGENFDSVAKNHTERAGFKNKLGAHGILNADANELSKVAFNLNAPGDISEVIPSGKGFSIVRLNEKLPARMKTFEEAKAEASGKYQDEESKRLEREYLESLKSEYQLKINYDKLEKAFKD